MQPRIAFAIAAMVEVLILGLITAAWPAKAAEGAVPIAIIVCGLVGLALPGPWYRVALLGAILGLLNTGVLVGLSSVFSAPEKFTLAFRIAISAGFGAATATGTWLWTQYEKGRDR